MNYINIEKILQNLQPLITTYAIRVIGALLVLIIGIWISKRMAKLAARLMERRNVDVTIVHFLKGLIYYSLVAVVVVAAAGQLGVNTTSFLTIVGAAGLAIGLALKDSLSNFASGIMLILFRPFRAGDLISTAGITGKVQSITLFNTILHTGDNQKIIIPNNKIVNDTITNITANETRRIDLVIGIGYEDDIEKAKAILHKILAQDERVLKDPAPTIAVSELADSSVNLVVRPWVSTSNYWEVRFDLLEQIKKAFDMEGINIPYPQQDVHLFTEKATS